MEKAPLRRGLAPSHPGVHLADALSGLKAETGLSREAVAQRLGVGRRTLYNVIEARTGVTAELAVRLEALGLGSAEMWLNLQQAFDLHRARQTLAEVAAEISPAWPPQAHRAA